MTNHLILIRETNVQKSPDITLAIISNNLKKDVDNSTRKTKKKLDIYVTNITI